MQNQKNKIIIYATLPVPLKDVFDWMEEDGKNESDTMLLMKNDSEKISEKVKTVFNEYFSDEKINAELKEINFWYSDSDNPSHAVAFFKIKLEGTEKTLHKIAGENKLFIYDWSEKK